MAIEPRQKELWLQELQLNGFIILRDFLPREWVEAVHEQLLPVLRGEYRKAEEQGFEKARGPGRLAFHLERYADLLGGALADDRYRRHPLIEELVDAVLGSGRWGRGWTLVEAAWSGSQYMGWHSDQKLEETPDPDGPHETRRVTYNIPLVDFTWANGAIEFIPGSHRLPRSFLKLGFLELPHLFSARLDLRRGDALLRDGNTLHRGTPNLTDHPRPMLDQTYKKTS